MIPGPQSPRNSKEPKAAPRRLRSGEGRTVRLRPANPFDLIRLIAQSQNDPRKAIAELVQNSLDAGAKHVTVTRGQKKGVVTISILDDGHGIFPDLTREEALERIANNVGHSFKRNLSAEERKRELLLGKYGIGILGFWAVGQTLEMRSRVAGSEVWSLLLRRNAPSAEVVRTPQRRFSFTNETWTEVVISGVHESAARQTAGRRLGEYLGSELRGQILERQVKLRIIDQKARGAAPRDFLVVPQRYRGRRIEELLQLQVVGHRPGRIELYFVDPAEERDQTPAISVTCGGTVVCDDVTRLEGADFARSPWTSRAFEGLIEFPDLEVAPATRRGILPGPAAEAFYEALRALEPELAKFLEVEREKRLEEQEEDLAREIRKAFRAVATTLPQYDFFEVRSRKQGEESPGTEAPPAKLGHLTPAGVPGSEVSEASGAPTEGAPVSEVVDSGDSPEPPPQILPPGPLETVRIVPRRSRLLPGASRILTAKAVDADGRQIQHAVDFTWILRAGPGRLEGQGDQATYSAPESVGAAHVFVVARQWKKTAESDATIDIVERLRGESSRAGIPSPKRVFDTSGDWRSRVAGRVWEYNAAHPDYQVVAEDSRKRLRYLVHLFAKEIVLRNYGEPKDERLLERLVEVLTYIDSR